MWSKRCMNSRLRRKVHHLSLDAQSAHRVGSRRSAVQLQREAPRAAALILANFEKHKKPETIVPKISQATLAEMVGTTRSRISFFMNKFRRLGLVDYNGHMTVNRSLLNVAFTTTRRLRARGRRSAKIPLWVTSGSRGASGMRPLSPQQQTSHGSVGTFV